MVDESELFPKKIAQYKGDFHSDFLKIYDIYVKSALDLTDRRNASSRYYLALNVANIALAGYVENKQLFLLTLIALAGLIINLVWYRQILTYKNLNQAKFKAINEMEKFLPISPFKYEWTLLMNGEFVPKHTPLTKLEIWPPLVFLMMHTFAILYSIPWALLFRCILPAESFTE